MIQNGRICTTPLFFYCFKARSKEVQELLYDSVFYSSYSSNPGGTTFAQSVNNDDKLGIFADNATNRDEQPFPMKIPGLVLRISCLFLRIVSKMFVARPNASHVDAFCRARMFLATIRGEHKFVTRPCKDGGSASDTRVVAELL
jgi:hypothetical protein